MNYRDECSKCGMLFLGVTRSEYIKHLRDEHGDFYGDIEEMLVVGKCNGCEITYCTEFGRCPQCDSGNGEVCGRLFEKDGIEYVKPVND